jgi:hypothetical protein
VKLTQAQQLQEAADQLRYHNKGSDNWVDTLNRLWRKNHFAKSMIGSRFPELAEEMLGAELERWPVDRLKKLLHPETHARACPMRDDLPIIVLLWADREFLIDGTTRINRRVRDNDVGPHDVVVIRDRNGENR